MPKPTKITAFDLSKELETDEDLLPLTFGKYEGLTPLEIADYDPSYITWMFENLPPDRVPFSKELYALCKIIEGEELEDDSYNHFSSFNK